MILACLILIPLIGGILAWIVGRRTPDGARWVSLAALVLHLAIAIGIWIASPTTGNGDWMIDARCPWIPQWGISLHLALDGLSLVLILLTSFLGILGVACSWTEIQKSVGFFHFNLLWILAGITGVFIALDLFLFYFLWELMLIPMYFLISIWGHERRVYAAIKFFLFTQASGLLMLLAILALVFIHARATGVYTFDYNELLGTTIGAGTATWLMLGFLVAFAVKIPVFPFHTWLPDAHTEAPTAGSLILAGLLLKTGAYGILRFVLPLFPQAALDFAPIAMSLAIVGIIYGAVLAFAQTDLKRLVAYTSVSHMGFVFLGIFAFNIWGMQGVVLQMVCHGLSTGALFVLVGQIYERTHTRDMNKLGGLWETAPRLAALGLVFAMASLGLPGMGNFLAEMLVLIGAYKANLIVTVIAATGLVAATIYSLWIVQKTFHGPNDKKWRIPDLNLREMLIMLTMVLGLLWLGLYPRPILKTTEAVAQKLADIPFLLPHEPDLPVLATEHAPADSAQNSAKLIQSKLEETL